MFEILVDLYVIVAHYMVQPSLLGLVNVGDTKRVLEGCNRSSMKHITTCNLDAMQQSRSLKTKWMVGLDLPIEGVQSNSTHFHSIIRTR